MALDRELLYETLSNFARALVTPYDADAALVDLTERVDGVLNLSGSGVTLWLDGELRFATALTTTAEALERTQEKHQQGPCLEAFRSGTPVLVGDLSEATDRWPDYADTAARLGIRAVAGVPMHLADRRIGALNLYASEPRDWSEEDIAAAQVLADIATAYIVNASSFNQQQQLAAQLQAALDSRVIIEQAKGITARDRGVSVDEAFVLMRQWARSQNVQIRDVAQQIVTSGLRV